MASTTLVGSLEPQHSHLYDACYRSNWALAKQIVADDEERSPAITYRHPVTGQTSLHVAVAKHAPVQVLKTLVEKGGAGVNDLDKLGLSALHAACEYRAPLEVVQYLLSQGANVNQPGTRDGSTPVHIAAQFHALPSVMAALLETGGEVNRVKFNGETPLYLAVRNRAEPELLSVLLDHGANRDFLVRDFINHTTDSPMSLAHKIGDQATIRLLEAPHLLKSQPNQKQESLRSDKRRTIEAARNLFRYAMTADSLLTVRESQTEENSRDQTIAVRRGEQVQLVMGSLEEGLGDVDPRNVLVSTCDGRVGKVNKSALYDPAAQ